MAFDAKSLPINGIVPVLQPLELHNILIKPPTVFKFESFDKIIIQELIDLTFLDAIASDILSVKNLQGISLLDDNRRNIHEINEYAVVYSDNLLNHLDIFYVLEYCCKEMTC